MMEIGSYIRKKRQENRLSMEYMAEEIGYSYQAYQTFEVGKVKLIHPALLKICQILKIDPCQMLRETSDFSSEIQEREFHVMEVLPEYINDTINQLKNELRQRDELIGVLKYKLEKFESGTDIRPGSKKVG